MRAEEQQRIETQGKGDVGMSTEKSVKNQKNTGVSDAAGEQQRTGSMMSQSSEVSRPTIGTTTISTGEAERIQLEVRSELRKMFPGIAQFEAAAAVESERREEPSRPQAIAGSEVSVASTRPNNGSGENQNSFSRMMSSGAKSTAQTFANV